MRGWYQNHSCKLLILVLIWNQVWLLVKESSSATLQGGQSPVLQENEM